jgi:hypothetical protein
MGKKTTNSLSISKNSRVKYLKSISLLKVYLFYVVIRLLSKLDLSKPFSNFASERITKISYYTISTGLFSYVARQTAKNLQHHGYVIDNLNQQGFLIKINNLIII